MGAPRGPRARAIALYGSGHDPRHRALPGLDLAVTIGWRGSAAADPERAGLMTHTAGRLRFARTGCGA
ncbi:hypothetical protein [Sphingomonas sp.]|uniref:hypothetical protein n=1 Tax=Sphingomonas sp. TaxID=28214 RepID=UPI003D6DA2E4